MNLRIFLFMFFGIQIHLFATEKDDMLSNLEFIERVFAVKYAPMEWKKTHLNWSLIDEIKEAKHKIKSQTALTAKAYQQILRTFFTSPHDYHVSIFFHSTEAAILPFSVKSAENRFFVSEAPELSLQLMQILGLYEGQKLITKGCELLQVNGQPMGHVLAEIKRQAMLDPHSDTAHSIATQLLTTRIGIAGHPMPEDSVVIKFKMPTGKVHTAKIKWLKNSEEIFYKYAPRIINQDVNHSWSRCNKIMAAPLILALKEAKQEGYRAFEQQVGLTDQNLPEKRQNATQLLLGKLLWHEHESSPFKAYIYESPHLRQKIGYIRLESYLPSPELQKVNSLITKLASIIEYMELNTEALVVDQVDNGGGLVLYSYAIAALLTNRPLQLPEHEMTLTQQEIMHSLKERTTIQNLLESEADARALLFGYPYDRTFLEGMLKYNNFLIEEWSQGKTRTSSFPLFGISALQPHFLASYSKPILMLVNESDFSAADFIPSIMQDNKRAIIFGTNTAGAGGCVEECRYPNLFGIATFSYTSSFARRVNGLALENLGVLPDIPYKISVKDLTNDYSDYKYHINEAVEGLLKSP